MKIGMIGLGNLGTAVGNLIAHNGHQLLGWEHDPEVVEEINEHQTNSRYLPAVRLHPELTATSDLASLFLHCEVVFIAIPSVFIRPTLERVLINIPSKTVLVNMAKGINVQTGMTCMESIQALLPNQPLVMLSGPSIANEFSRGLPTMVMIAGSARAQLHKVAMLLDTAYFRTRYSDDMIGTELGGILKNVYAIGLGLFDGQGIQSVNFRAVYLTLALEEMTRIGVRLGAQAATISSLAGMGDLLATALSAHSHNRHLGERLAQGAPLVAIQEEMEVLPEGYNTLISVLHLAEKLHVSMPLAAGLWQVINGRLSAQQFITALLKDFS